MYAAHLWAHKVANVPQIAAGMAALAQTPHGPRDVRTNLTATAEGQNGHSLPFDVSPLACLKTFCAFVGRMLLVLLGANIG